MEQQEAYKQQEASVSGVLFLSFLKACSNLEYYVDEPTLGFLSDVTLDGWYPLERYNALLSTVASRYSEPAVILESLGAEMMNVWYHEGPGQSIIASGIDFLRYQTGSEGYHSLIRGPADVVGDFALSSLSSSNGEALVVSTTPFNRDLERGVLRSGIGLTGELGLIRVDNSADPDRYLIHFSRIDDDMPSGNRALDAASLFADTAPPADGCLTGAALQRAYFRIQAMESELERQKRFWQSANHTLSDAMAQIRQQQEELVRTNAELSAASDRHQMLKNTIVDAALDAVITVDTDWLVREYNTRAEQLFGRRREDVIDRPIDPDSLPDDIVQCIQGELDGGWHARGTASGIDSDGRSFPLEYSVSRILHQDQALYTLYIRDISARVAAEEQIEKQRAALVQSEKLTAMGSLLAGVAHELNNPLSIVVGRSVMLLDECDDPAIIGSIEKIRAASERSMRIVKSFLAMARKQRPERAQVSVTRLLEDSASLLEYGYRTSSIELQKQIDPGLPELFADGTQLQQVFTNLLINAQQALSDCPSPRIVTIQARLDTADAAGDAPDQLLISISDNGPGVPQDIRDRIFEPFFTTKPMGTGTGVGLSLSHGIVASHGGSLSLAESPSGGAVFQIRLPFETPPDTMDDVRAAENTATSSPGARILIVDDEIDIGEMVSDMLEAAGHRTVLAGSGIDALAALDGAGDARFDLVLCDMNMAGMGGEALYREVQERYPAMTDRMAFITGDTLSAVTRRFLEQSGRPCLEKPFTPAELRERVGSWLSQD